MSFAKGEYWIKDEQGRPVRFEQIYDLYFEDIFRYALHRVGNVAEAEDMAAQTFFKALKNLWRFRWTGVGFSAWLYRIATNEINEFFRKQRKQTDRQLEGLNDGTKHSLSPVLTELFEAEQTLERHQVFLELNSCMRELDPKDQTLIALRFLEQKPFAEISKILGRREGTLVMRTHRALKRMKAKLQQRGIDHERIRGSFENHGKTRYSGGEIQAGAPS